MVDDAEAVLDIAVVAESIQDGIFCTLLQLEEIGL